MAQGVRGPYGPFVQKLKKEIAYDVHHQALSSDSTSYCHHIGFGHTLSEALPALNESTFDVAIEPLEYEKFLEEHKDILECDPIRLLVEFPADDIQVHIVQRKCRTLVPVVSSYSAMNDSRELDVRVKDCIHCYTSDYVVVHRRYQYLNPSYSGPVVHDCEFQLTPVFQSACDELDLDAVSSNDDLSSSTQTLQSFGSQHSVTCSHSDEEKDSLSSSSTRQSFHSNDTQRGSWASSDHELRNASFDPLIVSLFERIPADEVDRLNSTRRQENRHDAIFALYPIQSEEDGAIESRLPSSMPVEPLGRRILVKCLCLKLELDIEPIFASIALYDARNKKKISENFYLDLNGESTKRMLSGHIPYQDVSSMSRSCIFSFNGALSSDQFLVVRLEKVLQGDISECAEPYMKDDKNREKVKANAVACCDRLGEYRMPFAWTAISLFNVVNGVSSLERCGSKGDGEQDGSCSNLERKPSTGNFEGNLRRGSRNSAQFVSSEEQGSLSRKESLERSARNGRYSQNRHHDGSNDGLDSFRPITLTVSSFFKQESDRLRDEDLYKFLADFRHPTSVLKRLKCLPGTLKLDISPCPEEVWYALTPELVPVHPYSDDKARPTKEILEFSCEDVLLPNYVYRNLLYIYPKDVNFANRPGSARNITCKIQFMSGEDFQNAMPVIFGKSSCLQLSNKAYTTISYHNRSPDLYDEVKVQLPIKLTSHHHLLFSFYHVSCQKKVEQTPIETPIGYTWLPMLVDGNLQTGEFCLPVLLEVPPANYSLFPPEVPLQGAKWVDNHKGIFNVSVKIVSSIHTQDAILERFLDLCAAFEDRNNLPSSVTRLGESSMEMEIKSSICVLAHAKPEPLVQFMQIVLDKLIQLMVDPPISGGKPLNVSQECFKAIVNIVNTLVEVLCLSNDQHGRNGLLTTYIHYQCTLPHPNKSQLVSPPSFSKSTINPVQGQFNDRRKAGTNVGSEDQGLDNTASMKSRTHEMPGLYPVMGCSGMVHTVHEELVVQWIISDTMFRRATLCNSWFFFELMIKSMTEHLALIGQLDSQAPRKQRFKEKFMDDLCTLMTTLTADIIAHCEKDFKLAQSLNEGLAFFMCDALTILDRGFVFALVNCFCKQMSGKVTGVVLDGSSFHIALLRLDFLRIFCSHEHYIPLNLPLCSSQETLMVHNRREGATSPSPSVTSISLPSEEINTMTILNHAFRRHHFMVGLVLCELQKTLNISNAALQSKAIGMVHNLLRWHDLDPRYVDQDCRARVASLYLPFIGIVINALPQIHDFISLSTVGDTKSLPSVAKTKGGSARGRFVVEGLTDSSDTLREAFLYQQGKCRLSATSSKHLLLCFVWVLKNTESVVLHHWWKNLSTHTVQRLLEVLHLCISCFEFKGQITTSASSHRLSQSNLRELFTADVKSKLEEVILGQGSARNEMIRRRGRQSPSLSVEQNDQLRWRKEQTQWRHPITNLKNRPKTEIVGEQIEANLNTEVNIIVLDMLEIIVNVAVQSDRLQRLLPNIFQVLLHALSCNQSTQVLQNLFATQRSLVFKFPSLMFDEDTEQCADLCLQLLRHSSSPISIIRSQSSASLYLLMRQNFEIGNNFARVKMQVTMSLSSLAGTSTTFNESYIRRSLKTILTYAEEDSELQDTTFTEQVRDLVFNLNMILSDTVKMKEFQEDTEMLIDLMYRIAKGYQTSPDLRLTWLANMAKKHIEKNNHAEAAQCFIHSASLVAEYFHMLEDRHYLPIGAVSFINLSDNVLEESAISDDVISPDEEGICTGKYFSESGLVGLLEYAGLALIEAALYEAANHVYKILIPIAEAARDYKKLAQIHAKLHEVFAKIDQQTGKRVFGTYFRVGFYGARFGDLDREEFVYKEPVLTKLSEISHRLESFYTERFGKDVFEVIKDSNVVDPARLCTEKAYIQITYVEPHFDSYELRERVTYFEKNYNIKRFSFATPFTLDGRAHGGLHEQYKRKTVLTTAFSFPYVKTRIQVVDRTQVVLTPIEVAIEDIQKKTLELAAATHQVPPDPKILQMVLQGSLGTTVNQGPLEVAMVFLYKVVNSEKPLSKHQNKLRLCFKDFFKKCSDALKKNRCLIMADQHNYQRELERNYAHLTAKLIPMLQVRPVFNISEVSV